jgi:hypothetical protein
MNNPIHRKDIILTCTPTWVVAVDMGYGHQRPAHALGCLAHGGKVLNANNYKGIPKKDREIWRKSRSFYEWVSKFKSFPFLGPLVWNFFDRFQRIKDFYPKRDLSAPSMQVRSLYHYIEQGWGKDLIDKLNTKDMPLITTFFAVAFMAEEHGFKNEIYCVCTDTDVSRAWVAKNPIVSRIKYFCPNKRVYDRLKLYGVRSENLYITGFPLPLENIGADQEIVKADILERLPNLDPQRRYFDKYKHALEEALDDHHLDEKYVSKRPLTITFAVGGAGAQREIGVTLMKSLKEYIIDGKVHVHLVAGIHNALATYFKKEARKAGLADHIGTHIHILSAPTKEEYFGAFNELMRKTDILWTKPSELSFYSALGIPIIMAPPIGSQEDFNKVWLKTVGAGIAQAPPEYAHEWLFEWLESGWLAEAAMEGFLDAPKYGTYNIGQIVSSKPEEIVEEKMILQF